MLDAIAIIVGYWAMIGIAVTVVIVAVMTIRDWSWRINQLEVDADTMKREIKEEFVRVERRAGIIDKAVAEQGRQIEVLFDERLDGDEMLLERILKLERKLNVTKADTGEREGSGVERTPETEQVQEKPTGQGEETGGASGYPPVNYRRDYPRA